ncbi:uncharacterized protein LOC134827555 [Culicoides brevitarsis]|uniref:uncharacterized protein LOC134827555 n=1 Tax=Culicoides brevitarsis TaxID=469753 RepID=UPI00307B5D29
MMDTSLESGELGPDSPTNTSVSSLEEGEIRDSVYEKVTRFETVKERLLKKLNFSILSSENVDILNISKVSSNAKVLDYLDKQEDVMDFDEEADESNASLSQTVVHVTPKVARKPLGNVDSGKKSQGARLEFSQPMPFVQKCQISERVTKSLTPEKAKSNKNSSKLVNEELVADIPSEKIVSNQGKLDRTLSQIAPEFTSTPEISRKIIKKRKIETESVESGFIESKSIATQSELLSEPPISVQTSQSKTSSDEKIPENQTNEVNQELIETVADIPSSNPETIVSNSIPSQVNSDATLSQTAPEINFYLELGHEITKKRKIEQEYVESGFVGSKSQSEMFSEPVILIQIPHSDDITNDETFKELVEQSSSNPESIESTSSSKLTLSQIVAELFSTPEIGQEIEIETENVDQEIVGSNSQTSSSEILLNFIEKSQIETNSEEILSENPSNEINQELIETIADIPSSNLVPSQVNSDPTLSQIDPEFTSTPENMLPPNKKQKIQTESVESGFVGSKSLGAQSEFHSQPVILIQISASDETSNDETIKNIVNQELIETIADIPSSNSEKIETTQEVFISPQLFSSSASTENESTSNSAFQQPEKSPVLQKSAPKLQSKLQNLMKQIETDNQSIQTVQDTITQNTENFSLGFYTQSEPPVPQPKQAVIHRRRYRPRHFVKVTIPIMAQDIPKVETVDKFLFCLRDQFFDKVLLYGKCFLVKQVNDEKKAVYLLDDGTGKVIVHYHHQSKKILEEQETLKRVKAQIKSLPARTVSDYRLPLQGLEGWMEKTFKKNEDVFEKNTKVMVSGHFFHSKFSGKLEVSAETIFVDNGKSRRFETLFKKSLNDFYEKLMKK